MSPATARARIVAAFLLALASGGGAACRRGDAPGTVIVVGTIQDAATGAPLADVRVEGPRGVHAVSDAGGRFEIDDLAPGEQGELVARLPDGRVGRVALRPLEPGRLEVVLHLSRP